MLHEILCDECRKKVANAIDVKGISNPEARSLTIMSRVSTYMNELKVMMDHNLFHKIKRD